MYSAYVHETTEKNIKTFFTNYHFGNIYCLTIKFN